MALQSGIVRGACEDDGKTITASALGFTGYGGK